MKKRLWQCLTAAVLVCLYSIPVSAARLLIPVGEVVGLSLSEGSVTVAAFHESYGAAAREAGLEIGDEIVTINGKTVDEASDLYEALRCSDGAVTVELRRAGKVGRFGYARRSRTRGRGWGCMSGRGSRASAP